MPHKLTRRQLAASLSASAALAAQTPSPPPLPQNPDEELKAARALVRQNLDQLAKFELPIATEPATLFKP